MSEWQEFYGFLTSAGLTPDALYEALKSASKAFSGEIIKIAPGLLGAALAIRIISGVILEMIDGDLVDVIKIVVLGALMGGILGVILATWDGGEAYSVRTMTDQTLTILSGIAPGNASPGQLGSIIEPFFASVGLTIDTSMNALIVLQSKLFSTSSIAGSIVGAVSGEGASILLRFFTNAGFLVIAWASFIISVLAVFALLIAVVFYSMTGLFMIQLALAFGPLTIAVYPLINDWAKRVLSTVVGGMFQYIAGLLLLAILTTTVERFASFMRMVIAAGGLSGN